MKIRGIIFVIDYNVSIIELATNQSLNQVPRCFYIGALM